MTFNIDGSLSVKDPSGASPRAVTGEASGSNFAMHVKDVSGSSGGGSASGGGLSTYYAKPSGTNADATVAYTSATTITVTGLAYTFTAFDIVSIDRFTSANVYVETITPKTHTITVAAGVITVATGAFDAGDLFIVTFALPPKSIDETNDAQDVLVGNADFDRNEAAISLLGAPLTLTTSFADIGAQINVVGYKYITFYFTIDINNSNDLRLQFLVRHTSAGDEYMIDHTEVVAPDTSVSAVDSYIELLTDTDQLIAVRVPLHNTIQYIQAHGSVGTLGATAADIDAAYYTLGY
jgi:hypothetical protein